MRPVVTHGVEWFSLGLSVTIMSPAKNIWTNWMPFGMLRRVGPGCTFVQPGKYDWTVCVRRQCGLVSSDFDQLFCVMSKHCRQIHLCCRIHENYELLKARREMILGSKDGLEHDVKEQTAINRAHVANMNSLKPEIKRLYKQRDTYRKSVELSFSYCKRFSFKLGQQFSLSLIVWIL